MLSVILSEESTRLLVKQQPLLIGTKSRTSPTYSISGQNTIIPKPELRGFWVDSLTKPPFMVTSAEVVVIWPGI